MHLFLYLPLFLIFVGFIFAFPTLLLLGIYALGHRNERLGASLMLRWIERYKRKLPVDASMELTALLRLDHGGGQFEEALEKYNDGLKIYPLEIAFLFFISEENYERALWAAQRWSQLIDGIIEPNSAGTAAFFEEHGTDFSDKKFNELLLKKQHERNRQSEKPLPYKQRMKLSGEDWTFIRQHVQFYKSHLALGIMRWIMAQESKQLAHVKAVFRDVCKTTSDWRVEFELNRELALRLGMSEDEVAQLEQSIIGGPEATQA